MKEVWDAPAYLHDENIERRAKQLGEANRDPNWWRYKDAARMALTEPEHDLSAFWLYPDWDGPLKEPFWMRPLKLPEPRDLDPYRTGYHIGQRVEEQITDHHGIGPATIVAFHSNAWVELAFDDGRRVTLLISEIRRIGEPHRVRRQLTRRERYAEAMQQGQRLGFDSHGFKPSWLCRKLGRHRSVVVWQMPGWTTEWNVSVQCCGRLLGTVYSSDHRHSGAF